MQVSVKDEHDNGFNTVLHEKSFDRSREKKKQSVAEKMSHLADEVLRVGAKVLREF